ncbi:MAG: hypothetical protein FJW20_20675 [Acidimicrobiia bacterium]|nr:hypothetical protein [Acidimicrobiia bacterium]
MTDRQTPWYRSGAALVLGALIFPPAGLVLLWMRSPMGIIVRIFGSLVIAAIGVAHLFLFYGLHVEMDGTGMRPIFSFHKPSKHFEHVEEHRAAQEAPKVQPAAAPEVVQAATPAAAPVAAYWRDFRGPNRLGRYDEKPILTNWPASGLERMWKQPIGGGYASFTVAGGVAYTIEQRRANEVVAAYDVRTGRELWTNSWPAFFQESMGGDGPRATPIYDDGRVYALGAAGEFRAIDPATGRAIWNKNILRENNAENITWGMSNAPLVVDGKVIVTPGGGKGRSIVAYDKVSGKLLWSSLDDKTSYTSPMVVTLNGKRQIIAVTATRAVGLTMEEGSLLWEYPWTTQYDINCAQPIVVAPNRFFISAGYGHGAAVVELTPDGAKYQAKTVWANLRMKNKFNSSVLHEGHIYGLDEGILACVRADNGEQPWKGGRYGYGQLLLASGHLVVLAENGDLALVRATPSKHEELARFSAIDGKTWNHPVISDGILLVRNMTEMAAFRIAK